MPDPTPEFLHIASFIIHCRPSAVAAVQSYIDASERLEPGTSSPQGKLVVLAEGAHERDLLDAIETLESLEGVLECILVYHEVMSTAEAGHQLIARQAAGGEDGCHPSC